MKNKNNKTTKVLSKSRWLSRALDLIAESGKGVPSLEDLCKQLGVSRGSFYWHFKNRQDFLRCIAEYWVEYSVAEVVEKLNSFQGKAEDRMLKIIEAVILQSRGRHYLTMRFLAVTEPEVEKVLRKLDKQRLSFVKTVFYELGFRKSELEARTEAFVYFMTGEHVFLKDKSVSVEKIKKWRDIFVKP